MRQLRTSATCTAAAATVLASAQDSRTAHPASTDLVDSFVHALNATSWMLVILCAIVFGYAIAWLLFKRSLDSSSPAAASRKGLLTWAILTPVFIIVVPVGALVRQKANNDVISLPAKTTTVKVGEGPVGGASVTSPPTGPVASGPASPANNGAGSAPNPAGSVPKGTPQTATDQTDLGQTSAGQTSSGPTSPGQVGTDQKASAKDEF